jgi:hypothetical protein
MFDLVLFSKFATQCSKEFNWFSFLFVSLPLSSFGLGPAGSLSILLFFPPSLSFPCSPARPSLFPLLFFPLSPARSARPRPRAPSPFLPPVPLPLLGPQRLAPAQIPRAQPNPARAWLYPLPLSARWQAGLACWGRLLPEPGSDPSPSPARRLGRAMIRPRPARRG